MTSRGDLGEQMTVQTKSLYDRLGGQDVINALTESWVARMGAMTGAAGKFVRIGILWLKGGRRPAVCGHQRSLHLHRPVYAGYARRDENHSRRVQRRHAASGALLGSWSLFREVLTEEQNG